MSLPSNTHNVLQYLGYKLDIDYILSGAGGVLTMRWLSVAAEPTEAEINTIVASQAFLDWEAENGGDPTLTARRIIREAIDDPAGKVLVALVKVMIDQGIIAATPAQVRTAIENKIAAGEVD